MSSTPGPLGPEPAGRAFVLVAGIPGAGKSTLLRRFAASDGARVLDSDPLRERLRARLPHLPYRYHRPWVHLWHRLRIIGAALGPSDLVVVHLPATWGYTRAWLAALARLARRRKYLVWLDVDPVVARAGQRARGRQLAAAGFARHASRGSAFAQRLRSGNRPEGWSVTILDRTSAAVTAGTDAAATDASMLSTDPGAAIN